MAKISKEEILSAIEEMSVLDLNDLVKALEEKFGVSAAMMTASAPVTAAEAAAEPAEEKTIFNVELTDAGTNKIGVIKAIREINNTLGLAEAKALSESAPKMILEGAKKEAAEEAKKKLESAGAKVALK